MIWPTTIVLLLCSAIASFSAASTTTLIKNSPSQDLSAVNETVSEIDPIKRRNDCFSHNSRCPEHGNLELWSRIVETRNGRYRWGAYFLRINECNKCISVISDIGGCKTFIGCGRRQAVCVDWRKNRGHRIWMDNDHKTCYEVQSEYMCGGHSWAAWLHREVPCNW